MIVLVRACLLAVSLSLTTSAKAQPFTELIVFGDSLSDVGNTSAATFGIQPGSGYFSGRFSNGPVYAEHLANELGFGPLTRSGAGGDDYAYGGAETNGPGGLSGLFIDSLVEQVDDYVGSNTPDPNGLFVVFIGANDFFNGQTNASVPSGIVETQIGRLATDGARKVLGVNLPPLGLTPSNLGNATLNALTNTFNAQLESVYDSLEATHPNLTIFRLDVATLFSDLITNPSQFGFTNVTQEGMATAGGTLDAPGYLFWDGVHPTREAHELLSFAALREVFPAGDFNYDGQVDTNDFSAWDAAYNSTFNASLGGEQGDLRPDANGDGVVDAADYTLWRDALPAPTLSVPEPLTYLMLLIGVALACGQRTRNYYPACVWQ